jgi:hypothetical protein
VKIKTGDLVEIICDEDRFSDNYIKFILDTIGDNSAPIGLVVGIFAKADEVPEAVTFYRVLVKRKEHLIDENSLKIVSES